MPSPVEIIGWITIVTLSCKMIYNVFNFLYLTFLTDFLGRNVNWKTHGSWAGRYDNRPQIFNKYLHFAVIVLFQSNNMQLATESGDGSN